MKALAMALALAWFVVFLLVAALVVLAAPFLPAIPDEEDEHGR